jgi:HAE1 family hydrophobic/amphiphilic exporter-1
VVASGAGAASQQAIGTAVVGGMIAATFMSLLFTPVFYVVMQKLSGLRKKKPEDDPKDLKATAEAKQAMPEKSS